MRNIESDAIPFLKWAGGKRWLMKSHRTSFDISECNRYVEPFISGGAVFFSLAPKRSLLNDANIELIDTYRAIKSDWRTVARLLAKHQKYHDDNYYYQIRASTPNRLLKYCFTHPENTILQ